MASHGSKFKLFLLVGRYGCLNCGVNVSLFFSLLIFLPEHFPDDTGKLHTHRIVTN